LFSCRKARVPVVGDFMKLLMEGFVRLDESRRGPISAPE
jgi:hypothetical protein